MAPEMRDVTLVGVRRPLRTRGCRHELSRTLVLTHPRGDARSTARCFGPEAAMMSKYACSLRLLSRTSLRGPRRLLPTGCDMLRSPSPTRP